MIKRQDLWPLGAISFILAVTAAWWGLALWTAPGAPEWLQRTRSVCFNITEDGLPDAKGWLLLIGQPPTMLALLLVGWRDDVVASVGRLLSARRGRLIGAAVVTFAVVGLTATTARVLDRRLPELAQGQDEAAPVTYPRLDRPWPTLDGLVDQNGTGFTLESLDGQAALVTFAFGHCATICPMLVHQARQSRVELGTNLPIVVFTLDPWRDTPNRLPALTTQFQLDPDRDFVVSGTVDAVEEGLDAWGIVRIRDEQTGDITHPALIYLLDSDGTVAYGSTGGVKQLSSLVERLR
jgi:cytochrome oxidase Cu insertion factor (SCO1/SenC/PrrC family)